MRKKIYKKPVALYVASTGSSSVTCFVPLVLPKKQTEKQA